MSMYRFSYGDWDVDELTEKEPIWGYFIFFFLAFGLTGTLTNVFIALVGERYNENVAASEDTWVSEVSDKMAQWYGTAFEEVWHLHEHGRYTGKHWHGRDGIKDWYLREIQDRKKAREELQKDKEVGLEPPDKEIEAGSYYFQIRQAIEERAMMLAELDAEKDQEDSTEAEKPSGQGASLAASQLEEVRAMARAAAEHVDEVSEVIRERQDRNQEQVLARLDALERRLEDRFIALLANLPSASRPPSLG